MNEDYTGKTHVSVWGVLLSPVWLFLKLVIFVGNVLGSLASGILQWVAGIAFVLDILVWITMGFGMFMLVMIPIVLCYAFPYIWGVAFGILDTMCDGIAYLWHVPNKQDKYDGHYYGDDNANNNNSNNNNNRYYDSVPSGIQSNVNVQQRNMSPSNNTPQFNTPSFSSKSDDDWEPEGYAEFVAQTKAMNADSNDIQD